MPNLISFVYKLCIVTLPVFKQEALRYIKGCFCYFYMESFFYLILMNFLRKSLIRKMYVVSFYVNITFIDIKGAQKEKNSNF